MLFYVKWYATLLLFKRMREVGRMVESVKLDPFGARESKAEM